MILSLFDRTGEWAAPYAAQGTLVVCVDLQHEQSFLPSGCFAMQANVLALAHRPELLSAWPEPVEGILAAPPCTDFASSGAQWWKRKDADGSTARSVALVEATLSLIKQLKPRWWALENPRGRLKSLVPGVGPVKLFFHPCDFAGWADDPIAEAYTKETHIYGDFNFRLQRFPIRPIIVTRGNKRGSVHWARRGGTSLSTKNQRSKTPQGFARAFAKANPCQPV